MNKKAKTILIAVIVIIAVAAIAVFFVMRSNNSYIGKAAALECAYKDAGVTADEVIEKDADFEKKGGKAWYDVEFETFTTEYDYTIDARTGDVLYSKSEPRD